MKRIVTLVVRGDLPDSVSMTDSVADILEKHAADLRARGGTAGARARGTLEGNILSQGGARVGWIVEWTATYEQEGEPGT